MTQMVINLLVDRILYSGERIFKKLNWPEKG